MTLSTPLYADVDVAILGAGTAGLAAYRAAVAHTDRVVLIEAGAYGTTCARVGCMPSKLLIAAAEAVYHARHAEPFGITAQVQIDRRAVLDRVRRERDRFVGFVLDGVERIPPQHKLLGRARFVGPTTLEVGGAMFHARSTVIATGSSPVLPPMLEGLGDRLVVNDHVFDWPQLPHSVAVFGTGVIGLELGQALHRLGVRVRMFGRSGAIGPLSDPAVRAVAGEIFRAEFPLHQNATVHAVQREGDQVSIEYDSEGTRTRDSFEYVLAATGRRPNVNGLALENTGLALDPRGVPIYNRRTLQCGDSSIFISGDASHEIPILHEAADEGKIAGDNASTYPSITPGHRRSLLAITFSDPQIAIVGSPWSALSTRADVVTGEVSFEDQGRSRVMLQNRGLLHVYAEAGTGRFLGAEMIGPRAEHIGHLLAWSHQEQLTIDRMLEMPFYHPVVEEGLRTALRDASAKLHALEAKHPQPRSPLMLQNREGQRIPEATFRTREGGKWKDVSTRELFSGKRVVVFSLPGAFTPTCSSSHVPRYNELAPAFFARGIDSIVCLSVNDAFVMNEWAKDQGASHITFIPDGNGEFSAGMGMLVDKRQLGFGQRSWRYSMLVEDGVIKKMFIEPEVEGDPFEVSDADTMLRYLDPNAKSPPDILMFTKPGCGFCAKAKELLEGRKWSYDEVSSTPRRLRAVSGKKTTPQIFIDGEYIGGSEELEKYLVAK